MNLILWMTHSKGDHKFSEPLSSGQQLKHWVDKILLFRFGDEVKTPWIVAPCTLLAGAMSVAPYISDYTCELKLR